MKRRETPLHCFAAAAPGTEDLLATELKALGLQQVEMIPGGVSFLADVAGLFRANLHSRIANRVLVRVERFFAGGWQEFERRIGRVEWSRWLPPGAAVTVRAVAAKTRMNHTGRLEELTLEAIRSGLGPVEGAQTGGEDENPPLEVYLRVRRDKVVVSIDTSGDHLHRRGYRSFVTRAPLRENLAAACLTSLGYDGTTVLLDPCCGSGTFAVEAALIATRTPPGLGRSFAFERLPLYDANIWEALIEEGRAGVNREGGAPIYASDLDPEAVKVAEHSAIEAGVGELINFSVAPMEEVGPPCEDGLLVANPPYGLRLKGDKRAYRALAEMVKERFRSWRWGIIVCRRKEAAVFPVEGQESRNFVGAGLPLELRSGGS